MSRETPPARSDFPHVIAIPTRWSDNDVYGHVNNVVFYGWFDTVINRWLIAEGGLDPLTSQEIGLCIESKCRYVAPVSYPEDVAAALRVAEIGRSSVRYELAIFRGGGIEVLAYGHFVHVFVERTSRRPTPIPERLRAALERLRPASPDVGLR